MAAVKKRCTVPLGVLDATAHRLAQSRASAGNLYGNLCSTGLLAHLGSLLFGLANLTLVAGGTW